MELEHFQKNKKASKKMLIVEARAEIETAKNAHKRMGIDGNASVSTSATKDTTNPSGKERVKIVDVEALC